MMRSTTVLLAAAATMATGAFADAKKKEKPPVVAVGRTPMATPVEDLPPPPPLPVETIAQALPRIANHGTLVRLVVSAQLDATLAGPGPYTMFAPSDDAFARLAPGTIDTLLKPANVSQLAAILKYHVVSGSLTLDRIKQLITAGGGTASIPTMEGQPLTVTIENGLVLLTDAGGGKSYISHADLHESNGIVHVVNGLSVPKLS